jgi:hypothetical protein
MMNPTQPQMERLPSQSALKEQSLDGSAENSPSNRSGETQPSLIAELQKEFGSTVSIFVFFFGHLGHALDD